MDKNSMLYWYPKIQGEINVPRTVIVPVKLDLNQRDPGAMLSRDSYKRCGRAVKEIGTPCFVRTDLLADKHSWIHTCYLEKASDLNLHLSNLVDASLSADILGLPVNAFVFREFLHLKSTFKAFDGMPVAKEFRFFATGGKVDCWHPYWPESSIRFRSGCYSEEQLKIHRAKVVEEKDFTKALRLKSPEPKGWRNKLKAMSQLRPKELMVCSIMAEKASVLCAPDSWSVDLCEDVSGRWWLTDMALAEDSYHMPHGG